MMVPSHFQVALHFLLLFLSLNANAFLSHETSRPTRSISSITTTHHPNSLTITALNLQRSTVREAIDWFQQEPLETLLPKADALQILDELVCNETLIDDSEALVEKNWAKIESRIQDENRSPKELLGEETCDRLLKSVANADIYDNEAVRAFLSSDAINTLFAKILYDGIYEFFQTIDVFGNLISNLPIIGPIRNQIRDETKRNLDRTLGPLVQGFLRSYTKVAVLQASDFIMSPSNKKSFGNANVRLVSSILDRPISSLLPPPEMAAGLRKDLFDYVRTVKVEDLEQYADFVYDYLGDKSLNRLVNVNRILDSSPTLDATVERVVRRAFVNALTEESS
ncbi:unnamed protein product [Cylindrotheca closterium]|uniref:Uncharacterized protein n=1 Tax=Cylindrotheca closterium TaxID=2856 RepID=A0AAD2FGY7_9STRA|nr:unnamed protein product [Cylindrotheca closterium]